MGLQDNGTAGLREHKNTQTTGRRDYMTAGQGDYEDHGMRDYRNIEAWRRADDLTVAIYELTRSFPREEIYGLTSQFRRAAYSVSSNIAEGSARASVREYLHFLYIARGSLTEAQYFVHLSGRLGYLSQEDTARFLRQTKGVFAALHGLIKAVETEVL
jgi:four helix bundle protein